MPRFCVAQQVDYPLDEALDDGLTWTTGGNYHFVGQTDVSHDGYDAAMVILPAGASREAWLQTTITGPARVSFWWLYDSLTRYDFYFRLYLDASLQMEDHAASVWTNSYVDVPVGTHTLRWDAFNDWWSSYQFLAAVDQVTVTPLTGDAPQLTVSPSIATVQAGQSLTLHADATGTAPLSYNWTYVSATDPYGWSSWVTNGPTVTFNHFTRADAGTYTVTVNNLFGTIQSNAVLAIGFQSIADALNQPGLPWSLDGIGDWFAESSVTHDGTNALQSPPVYWYGISATLATTVTGPVSLKYFVKLDPDTSTGYNGTILSVNIDGVPARIYQNSDAPFDWRQDEIIVPFGEHRVTWEYGSDYGGHGTVWLDEVTMESITGDIPAITEKSPDATITEGQPITLSVVATGTPPLSYAWYLDDQALWAQTNSTLQLYGLPSDQGSYHVTVQNYFGAVQSDPINITVRLSNISLRTALDNPDLIWKTGSDAPWFGEAPVNHDRRSAAQGPANSWLQTTVVGPGILTFWWKAAADIQLLDTINGLLFTDAIYDHSGEWRKESVGISAGPHVLQWLPTDVAWVDSVHFTAGAVIPPRIVQQPQSRAIDDGETVTFSVKATGAEPLSYQWTYNGQSIDAATDSSLIIPDATSDNYGLYAVILFSPFGIVQSQSAILSSKTDLGSAVGDPGTGWTLPVYFSDLPWIVATNVTFGKLKVIQSSPIGDYSASSEQNNLIGPGTLSFWWRVSSETNADVLQFSMDDTVQATISGNTGWRYYTCHMSAGPHGVQWSYIKDGSVAVGQDCGWLADVEFTADPPPTIRIVPHELTAFEGSVPRFDTVCNSTNPPTISWVDINYNQYDGGSFLKFPNVGMDQAGWYGAFVTSDSGSASDWAFLRVKPAIAGQRVMAGSTITLNVHYPDTNTAGLIWTLNDTPLTEGGRVHGTGSTALRISNADLSDSGAYGIAFNREDGLDTWYLHGPVDVLPRGALVGWGIDDVNGGEIVWPNDLYEALSVATDNSRSAAVLPDGTVRMWLNSDASPMDVPEDVTDVVAIGLRASDTVALKKDGSTIVWSTDGSPTQPLREGVNTTRAISASEGHVLLLDRNGTVAADGANDYGESDVPSDLKGVSAVAAGNGFSLALLRSGAIVGWGNNDFAQLMAPHLTDAIAIAAGGRHALALRRNGTVIAWGDNSNGQTSVPRGLSKVIAIAAGLNHSVALTSDGRVVTWGGQYSGGMDSASVPVGLRNVARIAAGGSHTLALKYAPDIMSQPVAQLDDDPNFSTITVQASGRSPLSYAWRLNGKVISTNPSLTVRTPPTAQIAARQKYDVIVRNRYGSTISQQITAPPFDSGDGGFFSGTGPVLPGDGMIGVIEMMPGLPAGPTPLPPMFRSAAVSSSGIHISKQNDSIVLSWTLSGAVLECADSIDGRFTSNVDGVQVISGNTTTVTLPISAQQKFYRLRLQ